MTQQNVRDTATLFASVPEGAQDIGAFYDIIGPMMPASSGYWTGWPYVENPDEDYELLDAQQTLARLLAEKVGLRAGQQLLDVGCGAGGPAIMYAREHGATVTGVTLSSWQAETATACAREAGVGDQVRIQISDATKLPFASEMFDAALANGSFEHMPDVSAAFAEVFRTLRPGGRFSFSHAVAKESPTIEEEAVIKRVMPYATTLREQVDVCRRIGFEIDEAGDCTPNIRGACAKYVEHFQRVGPNFLDKIDPELAPLLIKLAEDFTTEAWNYCIVTVRKP
jgi:cyclopropane fatty-acyl-phospholipid synthase-like methyltransferase